MSIIRKEIQGCATGNWPISQTTYIALCFQCDTTVGIYNNWKLEMLLFNCHLYAIDRLLTQLRSLDLQLQWPLDIYTCPSKFTNTQIKKYVFFINKEIIISKLLQGEPKQIYTKLFIQETNCLSISNRGYLVASVHYSLVTVVAVSFCLV